MNSHYEEKAPNITVVIKDNIIESVQAFYYLSITNQHNTGDLDSKNQRLKVLFWFVIEF